MSERDPLGDLLRRHDRPVAPAADFADRLEARLLAELGPAATARATRRPESLPIQARPRGGTGSTSGRRPRWLDTAAAAVLLVGLMGGMLSRLDVRDRGGDRTDAPATVAAPRLLSSAPGEEVPVMGGGSAARDNRFAGPGLTEGPLTERWAVDVGDAEFSYLSEAIAYGDMAYAAVWDGTSTGTSIENDGYRLEARSLSDGELVWSRSSDDIGGTAVSRAGVAVVLVDAGTETTEAASSALVMLDLVTGAEVWRYALPEGPAVSRPSPVVVDDTLYYVDAGATVYALGLDDGQERWVSDDASSPANAPTPVDQFYCEQPVLACQSGQFAVGDDALYVVNSDAELVALDLEDGAERWTVDVAARFGIRDRAEIWPTATTAGVVVGLTQLVPSTMGPSSEGTQLALLEGEDGAVVWSTAVDGYAGFSSVVADGDRLYLPSSAIERGPYAVRAYDLATGEALWRTTAMFSSLLGMMGDGRLYAWTTIHPPRQEPSLYALDPATGEMVDHWELPHGTPSLATARDGTLLLSGDGTLTAFRPSSSARAAVPAVMEGGSPARDNRWAGPGLTAGELEARWSVDLELDTAGFGGIALATVIPFRDLVYVVAPHTDASRSPGQRIEARDLATGEVCWTTTTRNSAAAPTVSEDGILVVESEPAATYVANELDVRLRMLDLTTGAERWGYSIEQTTTWSFHSAVVADGTVYYVDANGVAYALDAETGAEQWVSRGPRAFPVASNGDCEAAVEVCDFGSFAYRDGLLYLVNGAAEVYALDARTGTAIWKVDIGERYALRRTSVAVLATDRGVVLNMTDAAEDPEASGSLPVGYRTALLDRDTGDEVWTRDDVANLRLTSSDGERLFLPNQLLTSVCCSILALDLATGETAWELSHLYGYPLGIVGGAEPVLVQVDARHEEQVFIVGVDPATGGELWRIETDQDYPLLPLAPDGTLFTQEGDGTLTAFRLVPAPVQATPVATPVAAEPDEETHADAFEPDHVVSAGEDVNLRAEPSTAAGGATVIEPIPDGTPLRATGKTAPADSPDNGPWIQVELRDGTVGWLREGDVSRT